MRLVLLLEAIFIILRFEYAARRGYRRVHAIMKAPVRSVAISKEAKQSDSELVQSVCVAVNRACSLYPKSVLCLQRAGVTAWMLKKRGLAADVAVGIKKFPFQAHAWVEIGGAVVNDHPQVRDKYLPIERYDASTVSPNARVSSAIERGRA